MALIVPILILLMENSAMHK